MVSDSDNVNINTKDVAFLLKSSNLGIQRSGGSLSDFIRPVTGGDGRRPQERGRSLTQEGRGREDRGDSPLAARRCR